MKNLLKKYRHSEEGFTLIELIIVIAILAIIAAIAIPNIIGAVDDSRKTADIANAKVIANAAAQAKAQNDGVADAVYAVGVALDVTALDGSSANTDATKKAFEDELYKALNSSAPDPKFKPGTYKNFYLVITTNQVAVYVDGDANVGTGGVMLYPTVKSGSDYDK